MGKTMICSIVRCDSIEELFERIESKIRECESSSDYQYEPNGDRYLIETKVKDVKILSDSDNTWSALIIFKTVKTLHNQGGISYTL